MPYLHIGHLEGHDCLPRSSFHHNLPLRSISMGQTEETGHSISTVAQNFPQFQAQRLRLIHHAKLASGNFFQVPSVLFWVWKLVPAVALLIGVQPRSFRRRVHSLGRHLSPRHSELLEYGLPSASAKLVLPIVPLTSPVVIVAVHHVLETVFRLRIHDRRAAGTGLVWEDSGG